jgi:hypothetical protein
VVTTTTTMMMMMIVCFYDVVRSRVYGFLFLVYLLFWCSLIWRRVALCDFMLYEIVYVVNFDIIKTILCCIDLECAFKHTCSFVAIEEKRHIAMIKHYPSIVLNMSPSPGHSNSQKI